MKHRVYMRDWHYNAGIVGFLALLHDFNAELKDIEGLNIEDNYIEFDDSLLDGLYEKHKKHLFEKFNPIRVCTNKINEIVKEREEDKGKKNKYTIKKVRETLGKYHPRLTDALLAERKYEGLEVDKYIAQLTQLRDNELSESPGALYKRLLKSEEGEEVIQLFLPKTPNRPFNYNNLKKHIDSILNIKEVKKIKDDQLCIFCQERKHSGKVLNNTNISNFIGFNDDCINWTWGGAIGNFKICSVCAFIYSCAFHVMPYTNKKEGNEKWKTYYYTLNYNSSILDLYENTINFITEIEIEKQDTFTAMISSVINIINEKQSEYTSKSINFIEIQNNETISNLQARGYNLYNFNIGKELGEFLDNALKNKKLPKGYIEYAVGTDNKKKKSRVYLGDNLIRKTVNNEICYTYLDELIRQFMKAKSETTKHKWNDCEKQKKTVEYIFSYINFMKKGEDMNEKEAIIKKGFANGKSLRNRMKAKEKENQINGLVYGFLNDLKITDTQKFLDRYMRVIMANDERLSFGEKEMSDKDNFIQFGYSFINGLMFEGFDKNNENNKGE